MGKIEVFFKTPLKNILFWDLNDYISCKSLFRNYQNYCKNNNIINKMKEKNFKLRVINIIPFKERYMIYDEEGKRREISSVFTNIKENYNDFE